MPIDNQRTLVALPFTVAFMMMAALGACFLDLPYKLRGPTVPEDLGDGWETATPESVGVDPNALAAIHDEILREDRHFGILGLIVIKDGKLVFETYTRTLDDRDRRQALQSATKSVTALVFGAARDRGEAPALDATVCSVAADACAGLDAAKRDITLEHLLTMRSGIAFDNEQFSVEIMVDRPDDPLRYILEKPLYASPGDEFYYRDADPQILSSVLHRSTGRTLESLGAEYLFAPLAIDDYLWEAVPGGASAGAFALHLRPRDFAKLGQLTLEHGRWRETQIVSSAWNELATATQVPDPERSPNPFDYGYYFWVTHAPEAHAFWGHGGQFALVVPDEQLVLVQVALPYTSGDLHGSQLQDFIDLTRPLWE